VRCAAGLEAGGELGQLVEIAAAPARGGEAEPGDEREQQDEDDQRRDVMRSAVMAAPAPQASVAK
jgi:hypothetical protein